MVTASLFISNHAAYPTPHRTDQNSVQRTLRRIELTKIVCSVPYAAHFFPCGNFGAITPPALRTLRLMVCLPHSGYTLESPGLASATQTTPGNNTWEKATPLGVVPSPTHNAKAESRHRLRNTDA